MYSYKFPRFFKTFPKIAAILPRGLLKISSKFHRLSQIFLTFLEGLCAFLPFFTSEAQKFISICPTFFFFKFSHIFLEIFPPLPDIFSSTFNFLSKKKRLNQHSQSSTRCRNKIYQKTVTFPKDMHGKLEIQKMRRFFIVVAFYT